MPPPKFDHDCNLYLLKQVERSICWIHASIAILFLSDEGRKYVWRKFFVFEDIDGNHIPRKLRSFETSETLHSVNDYTLFFEIVRQMLEKSTEYVLGKQDEEKAEGLLQTTMYTANNCNIYLYYLIKSIFAYHGSSRTTGGDPTYVFRAMSSLVPNLGYYGDSQIIRGTGFPEGMTFSSFLISYTTQTGTGHAVSYLMCNSGSSRDEWYFFDNNRGVFKIPNVSGRQRDILALMAETKLIQFGGKSLLRFNQDNIIDVLAINFNDMEADEIIYTTQVGPFLDKGKTYIDTLNKSGMEKLIYVYLVDSDNQHAIYELFESSEEDFLEHMVKRIITLDLGTWIRGKIKSATSLKSLAIENVLDYYGVPRHPEPETSGWDDWG